MENLTLTRRLLFVLLCKALSSFLIFDILLWVCRYLATLVNGIDNFTSLHSGPPIKAFTASAFLSSVLLLQIFVRGKLLFSRGYLAATNEYRGPTDQEAVAMLCGRKGNRGSEPLRCSEMNAGVLCLIKLTFLHTRQL